MRCRRAAPAFKIYMREHIRACRRISELKLNRAGSVKGRSPAGGSYTPFIDRGWRETRGETWD